MPLDRSPDASLRRVGSSTRKSVRLILAAFDAATPADVEAGAQWYSNTLTVCESLAKVGGISVECAAVVFAHLSTRTTVARNTAGAFNVVLTGNDAVCMRTNVAKAKRALALHRQGRDVWQTFGPTSPKTRRFALNILGDREAVTVDVWAARVAGIDEKEDLGRAGVYDAVEHAYRIAARRRGVDPTTMQATTWIVARNGRAA